MRRATLTLIILLLTLGKSVVAQIDPHFSQYYAYPLWLNPALTGVVDGEARVTGNFRDQWTGINSGYRTAAISGDFRYSDKIALGVNIIDQTAGSAGYNYLATYGTFAYQVPVSPDGYHKLNFGLQAGIINRSFDASKLQMDNQYNSSIGYDPSMPNFENFNSNGSTIFDATAGVFYYDGTPSGKLNLFGGVSVAHLASGKDAFSTGGLNDRVPMRLTIHSGVRINAADFLDITPHVVYIKQQKAQEQAAGVNFELSVKSDYSLILGGMYRKDDAFVGNIGLYMKNLVVGISYDYTNSPLQQAANFKGGYELSVSYIFKRKLSRQDEKCPRL